MTAAAFVAAGVLDALAGDPRWFPHPVRAIGFATDRLDRNVRAFAHGDAARERIGGAAIVLAVVLGSALVARGLGRVAAAAGGPQAFAADVALAWMCLAARDLIAESDAVLDALDRGDLMLARSCLARIVGRDTDALDEAGIARATVETLAESCCDGIVAPLCALALGGPPLAFAFKAASTLDSMIGHIEPPHTHLGFAAAKLDDVLCYLPARIAAFAIALCAPLAAGSTAGAIAVTQRDGAKHPSPNAGRVEAAMAGALGVCLGGPLAYGGERVDRALFGGEYPLPGIADIRRARTVVIASSLLVFVVLSVGLSIRAARAR